MNVPKLRFKEFQDAWSPCVLNDFVSFAKGKGIAKADIDDDGVNFCIRYGELYTTYGQVIKTVVSKTNIAEKDSILSKAGDVIIPASGETQIDIATAACVTQNGIILGGDLNILSHSESGEWLAYYLSSTKKFEIAQLAQGNSVVHLYSSQLKDLSINKPSHAEQTKIASFLSAVDDKIAALRQEHDLWQQYKQGMIQQLFSQTLRFQDDNGQDFPDWEEISLKNFLILKSRPINTPKESYHALGVRSHFKGLFNKFDSDPNKISMETLYQVHKDDFVVNITFAWEGALAIAKDEHHEGLVSHRFPTYRCDETKVSLQYFKYCFIQPRFLSAVQLCSPGGAGRNRVLSKKDFMEINIPFPCLQEQTKIADCLSSIDDKIDALAQQLEQARLWKQGLLQQMFV